VFASCSTAAAVLRIQVHVLRPPKAALKVSATFTVRLLPDPDTVDPRAAERTLAVWTLWHSRRHRTQQRVPGVVEQPEHVRVPIVEGVTGVRPVQHRVDQHVVVDRSANPFGSEKTKLNVWLDSTAEDGVTETLDGGRLPATGMVKCPIAASCSTAAVCPARSGTGSSPRQGSLEGQRHVHVRFVPSPETVDPAPLSVHWLFCHCGGATRRYRGPSREVPRVIEQPEHIRVPIVEGVTASRPVQNRIDQHVGGGQVGEPVGIGEHEAEGLARSTTRRRCDGNVGRRLIAARGRRPSAQLFASCSTTRRRPARSGRMFFAPPKAALKVSARFTVRLLLDPETDDPAPLSVHWLFVSWRTARV